MGPKKLILFLISSSLLSIFYAEAICVPRNASLGASAPAPVYASPIQPPSAAPDPSTPSPPTHHQPPPQSSPSPVPSNGIPFVNPVLQKICGATSHPQDCLSSVAPFLTAGVVDPLSVLKSEMQALRAGFEKATAVAIKISKDPSTTEIVKGCLDTCLEVFDSGVSDLEDSLAAIVSHDIGRLNTLLSATISYVSTCEDAFAEQPDVESPLKEVDQELDKLGSNALAIAALLHWS